jgi:F0F1-type ATP synthase membrane subunit c/vacuolar-type H+-ATPase subunit K
VTMFLIIGLVEGMYFINLALGFFFIYVIAK